MRSAGQTTLFGLALLIPHGGIKSILSACSCTHADRWIEKQFRSQIGHYITCK